MEPFVTMLKEYGPFVALVAFFVWRDSEREKSLNKTIANLDGYIRTTLSALLEKTTDALSRNTEAHKDVCETIRNCKK